MMHACLWVLEYPVLPGHRGTSLEDLDYQQPFDVHEYEYRTSDIVDADSWSLTTD